MLSRMLDKNYNFEGLPSYELGMEKGIERGFEKGIEQGIKQAIFGIFSYEKNPVKIAQILNIDKEKVIKILNLKDK